MASRFGHLVLDGVGRGQRRQGFDAVVIIIEIDRIELADGLPAYPTLNRPHDGIDVIGIESEHRLSPCLAWGRSSLIGSGGVSR